MGAICTNEKQKSNQLTLIKLKKVEMDVVRPEEKESQFVTLDKEMITLQLNVEKQADLSSLHPLSPQKYPLEKKACFLLMSQSKSKNETRLIQPSY